MRHTVAVATAIVLPSRGGSASKSRLLSRGRRRRHHSSIVCAARMQGTRLAPLLFPSADRVFHAGSEAKNTVTRMRQMLVVAKQGRFRKDQQEQICLIRCWSLGLVLTFAVALELYARQTPFTAVMSSKRAVEMMACDPMAE